MTDGTTQQSFPQGFLASQPVKPGSEEAREMTAGSGRRCYESCKHSLPDGSLLKTFTACLLSMTEWHSSRFALTWKDSATKYNRLLFRLVPSTQSIDETESLLLPTIGHSEPKGTSKKRYRGSVDYHGAKMVEGLRLSENDPAYLSPGFAEAIMGFPEGWTELQHSETQ